MSCECTCYNERRTCKLCSPVECEKCKRIYSNKTIKRHMTTCKPVYNHLCEHEKKLKNCKICLPSTCEKCNKTYSRNVLQHHVKKCNGIKEKKIYACPICTDSIFRDSWCLKRHYKGSPGLHAELIN